ncbi:NXPE family member 3-like [Patiria miniata]|uniref:NXPE C-terminal domain-containing protein n=1 Tax=Patiria miniata TaxID=46514 RepID=A0A913ZG80_PATMI|nr:NXPE family member 3-like [Patiria miniata]
MRLSSTITVTYKDFCVAVLIFGTATVSIYCLWTMMPGTDRHVEQTFGAKTGHRQRGLSVLKDITRNVSMKQKSKQKIVDPPVDGDVNVEQKDQEVEFDAIRRVYPEEYALQDVSKLTSSAKSFYRIEGDRQNIKLGDTLHVIIQARDGRGWDRGQGGDFWFATLATKRNSSGTAGRVLDYDNGTYSAFFTVGWSGKLALEIMLVHPSHVGAVMTNVIWNERDRVEWAGRFEMAPNSPIRSDQRCVLRRQYVPLIGECVMTYPKAMGQTVLMCDAPGPGIKCDGLSTLFGNLTAVRDRIKSFTRNYYKVFSGDYFKKRLVRGPSQLVIKESEFLRQKLQSDQANLPACQPDLPSPDHGLGYWEKDHWHSLLCRAKNWSDPAEIGQCLRGKEVYFLGDSVLWRWMETLLKTMGVPAKTKKSDEEDVSVKLPSFNISLNFRLHPLTFTPNGTSHRKLTFEVDVMDSLKNKGCNYAVVVGTWAHFAQWTRESFVERVGLLREAVLRLRARCPAVRIAVAGPHPRDQPSKESRIYHNDLIVRRMGEFLEDSVSQSGALYLDRWDLNLGYPSSKRLHMPSAVIRGELGMFLSYVCGMGEGG